MATSEAGDAPGFAPLGERLWAVCPTVDRLYYSVWGEDYGTNGPAMENQVWSVRLDASGAIVPGTRQLEFATAPVSGDVSSPISDITFDGDCTLYSDGKDFSNPKLARYIALLLKKGVAVALVTAAGYAHDADKYSKRLSGLLDAFRAADSDGSGEATVERRSA